MMMELVNKAVIVGLIACLHGSTTASEGSNYLAEPPVKLLSVRTVAERFNASKSPCRISLTNGEVRN